MKAIVCVGKNWEIGNDNKLLFTVPGDLKQFKEITTGNVCVMGYNTLMSLPNSKPLKDRVNIVLTSKQLDIPGLIVCHNLTELFSKLEKVDKEIYVIGGESVYKQLLPYCEEVLITRVNAETQADTYFPNLDELKNWECSNNKLKTIENVSIKNNESISNISAQVVIYRNKQPLSMNNIKRADESLSEL